MRSTDTVMEQDTRAQGAAWRQGAALTHLMFLGAKAKCAGVALQYDPATDGPHVRAFTTRSTCDRSNCRALHLLTCLASTRHLGSRQRVKQGCRIVQGVRERRGGQAAA